MSGEKTEQPTPKKLQDARKKGQVAISKDVVSTTQLIALFLILLLNWRWYFDSLQEMIILPSRYIEVPFDQALTSVSYGLFWIGVKLCLPVLAVSLATTIFSHLAQVGPLLVTEPVKPDLKKIDPIQKAKQIFSLKNLFEFAKSSLKVTFLSVLIVLMIRNSIGALVNVSAGGLDAVVAALIALMWQLGLYTGFAYVVVAVADFAFQKYNHAKGLRMSKDEIKREYKELEGDPTIKAKRRQLHQELIQGDVEQRVKKSSVLVTNPTHLAVALFYERGATKLPIVMAKAEGDLAGYYRKIAEREGIPIMRNVMLARALYATVDIEQFIPRELLEPVAEVLRWVYEIRKQQDEGLNPELHAEQSDAAE